MDAKSKSLTFLSNEGIVVIPFFQRSYVWERDNWDDLLTDLLNFKKNHFLGSLILKQQPPRSGEPKEVHVIDGQQRLTTLSILVKALYDSFSGTLKTNCELAVKSNLFYKQYQTDSEFSVKIQHSYVDASFYSQVIKYGIDGDTLPKANESDNRIIKCYWHFNQKLAAHPEHVRKSLFNSILDQENKMLVVIDLYKEDDEQAIFDTINSAGVRLSSADIVKNALFQRLLELHKDANKTADVYERTWQKCFLRDQETISYWETERMTGRLKRDNIELLLHAIGVIKGFYDPDVHTLSDLADVYKTEINKYQESKNLITFLEEIQNYADVYRTKILSSEGSTLFEYKNFNQRLLHILDCAQISTFHPFILYVHKNFKNDGKKVEAILADLERFIVRRMVAKGETKAYNKICKEFIGDSDQIVNALDSDANVIDGLKSISNKTASTILFWIELYRRSDNKKFDTAELKYNYSLEHIMPQKWEEYWNHLPAKNGTDGKPLNAEQLKAARYEKIYWIGNMTLLTSSLNSSLRNYSYEVKMAGEGRKKGIRAYADLSITKHDLVEKFDKGEKAWNESNIELRTAELVNEFQTIWGLNKY